MKAEGIIDNEPLSEEDQSELCTFKKWIRAKQKNSKNENKISRFVSVWDDALFELKNADTAYVGITDSMGSHSCRLFRRNCGVDFMNSQDSITELSNSDDVIQVRLKDEAVIKYLSEGSIRAGSRL